MRVGDGQRRPGEDADDIAATWDALVLGTRDYVRKCGFSKALVGLTGGIDSALVAAIAVEALGAENVLGVGMPSEFSSADRSTTRARWRRTLASGLSCWRSTMCLAVQADAGAAVSRARRLGWRRRTCSRGYAARC